eukprot:Skav227448  [mRNA]  locus=scaffold2491:104762:106624:+ [translate_table: standard]
MLGRFWIFQAALVISVAAECDKCDDTVMLQSSASRKKDIDVDGASTWSSPRDVAVLREPDQVTFQDGQFFQIFSAVPSFGDDGNFIALLMSENSSISLPAERAIFCSGPGRSHLTKLRVKRRNLLCDWPVEEKNLDNFEVFLEDDQGNSIGKVLASRKADIAQGKFRTVMCVRDVYARGDRDETDFGRLLQFMEYNVQHGIDHFFVYTFRGTDEAVKDVLMPYLNAGLATRIHSAVDPAGEPNVVGYHFDQVIRDCLYRAKSHATWVIPSFDNDEYFHLQTGRMFHNKKVPQDYMRTVWDAIRMAQGKRLDQVRSISFSKIRAVTPRSNEAVQISSPWREDKAQNMMGHPATEVLPKYAFNAHVAWDAWWHWVWEPEPGTEDLKLDKSLGFVQHYRIPWGSQLTTAKEEDRALREDAENLKAAIEARFGEKLNLLLRRLNQKRPSGYEGHNGPVLRGQ